MNLSRSGDATVSGKRIGRVFKVRGGWAAEHRYEDFVSYRLPETFKRQSDAAVALLRYHNDWAA
jgi:hypothetical protein